MSYTEHTTLLPRLESLSVRSLTHSEDQFDWVAALFCDSLLEINVVPNLESPPPLSLSTAVLWLDTMSTRCPKLQVLSLYPYNEWCEWDEAIPDTVSDIKFAFLNKARVPMTQLTQLRRLSVNMYLTGPSTLTAIAGLPNLEHLEIGITYREDVFINLPTAAKGLFPKLKHLSMHHLNMQDMLETLEAEYILRGLTSLDLVVDPKPFFEEVEHWEWDSTTWRDLGQNLRQATRLKICFDAIKDDEACITLSEADIGHLVKIPLEYVYVRKAEVHDEYTDETPCELLARTWPNITHLHWPDQPANMEDLIYFVALPRLCHLTLDLQIVSVSDEAASSPASGPECFQTLECSKADCGEEFEPDQVGQIAK